MANTATLLQEIPCSFSTAGFGNVYQYAVAFDTVDSDLTIHAPSAATMRAAVVGLYYAEATAHNLVWKSGTTELLTLQMPASSGQFKGVGPGDGALVITLAGEDLVARCTTAVIATALVYVAEIGAMGLNFQSA